MVIFFIINQTKNIQKKILILQFLSLLSKLPVITCNFRVYLVYRERLLLEIFQMKYFPCDMNYLDSYSYFGFY